MMKMLYKQSTTKRNKNRKVANLHKKNDLLKATMSQQHKDCYGFVKSRVAKRTVPARPRGNFFRYIRRKWYPKDALLKIMKIENCTKIKLFIKTQHLDPLKTVPGSGFEKT